MNLPALLFRRFFIGIHRSSSGQKTVKLGTLPGVSLIEVVIALGIVAFVIIPVVSLLSSGMKNMRQSMDDTVLAGIAREIAVEALRTTYGNVVATNRYYNDEGTETTYAKRIFVAQTSLTNLPASSSLGLTTDTSIAQMLTITVYHYADSNNNRAVFSQLLLNTHQ